MAIGEKMAIWEREIVPDWRKVLRPGNERLRRLWWDGIPGNLRGRLWVAAIGNGLALSKGIHPFRLVCVIIDDIHCFIFLAYRNVQNLFGACTTFAVHWDVSSRCTGGD